MFICEWVCLNEASMSVVPWRFAFGINDTTQHRMTNL